MSSAAKGKTNKRDVTYIDVCAEQQTANCLHAPWKSLCAFQPQNYLPLSLQGLTELEITFFFYN